MGVRLQAGRAWQGGAVLNDGVLVGAESRVERAVSRASSAHKGLADTEPRTGVRSPGPTPNIKWSKCYVQMLLSVSA